MSGGRNGLSRDVVGHAVMGRNESMSDRQSMSGPGSIEQIHGYIRCAAMSQVIAVAAELDIPALLLQRPWRLCELAAVLGCDEDALCRLLRALASIGWCTIADDRIVHAADGFNADDARSFRSPALWCGRYRWPVCSDLLHSVRTGKCAMGTDAGRIGMHELPQDPAAAQIFHGAMAGVTQRVVEAVLDVCDLSEAERIVDVGGGHAELLGGVLLRQAAARAVWS